MLAPVANKPERSMFVSLFVCSFAFCLIGLLIGSYLELPRNRIAYVTTCDSIRHSFSGNVCRRSSLTWNDETTNTTEAFTVFS